MQTLDESGCLLPRNWLYTKLKKLLTTNISRSFKDDEPEIEVVERSRKHF